MLASSSPRSHDELMQLVLLFFVESNARGHGLRPINMFSDRRSAPILIAARIPHLDPQPHSRSDVPRSVEVVRPILHDITEATT